MKNFLWLLVCAMVAGIVWKNTSDYWEERILTERAATEAAKDQASIAQSECRVLKKDKDDISSRLYCALRDRENQFKLIADLEKKIQNPAPVGTHSGASSASVDVGSGQDIRSLQDYEITTISTNDKTYNHVSITSVDPYAIHFIFEDGAASVPLGSLSKDLQERYRYDPQKALQFHVEEEQKTDQIIFDNWLNQQRLDARAGKEKRAAELRDINAHISSMFAEARQWCEKAKTDQYSSREEDLKNGLAVLQEIQNLKAEAKYTLGANSAVKTIGY